MNLYPYDMRVVVKPDSDEDLKKSDSGLILSVNNTTPYRLGVVIAVGAHDTVKVGDRLLWRRSRGMPILENGQEDSLLLERDDILAKVLP